MSFNFKVDLGKFNSKFNSDAAKKFKFKGGNINFASPRDFVDGVYTLRLAPLQPEKNPDGIVLRTYHDIPRAAEEDAPVDKTICPSSTSDDKECMACDVCQAVFAQVEEDKDFKLPKPLEGVIKTLMPYRKLFMYCIMKARCGTQVIEKNGEKKEYNIYFPDTKWLPVVFTVNYAEAFIEKIISLCMSFPSVNDMHNAPLIHFKKSGKSYDFVLAGEGMKHTPTDEEIELFFTKQKYPGLKSMGIKDNGRNIERSPEDIALLIENSSWYSDLFSEEAEESLIEPF